jgi:hypothetical protein
MLFTIVTLFHLLGFLPRMHLIIDFQFSIQHLSIESYQVELFLTIGLLVVTQIIWLSIMYRCKPCTLRCFKFHIVTQGIWRALDERQVSSQYEQAHFH